ncbi:hypothetical protein ACJX0J_040358, partial [Zea mays]
SESPAAEASTEGLKDIVRHAVGKNLSEEQIAEAIHYAKDLNDEDDFLYCDVLAYKQITFCNAEDESCQIALGNLRNEAHEKDKILLSLLNAQFEAHKAEQRQSKR